MYSDDIDGIIDGDGNFPIPANPDKKWVKRVVIRSGVSDPRKIELLSSLIKQMVSHGKRDRSIRKRALDILRNYGSHIEKVPDNHPFIIDSKTGKPRHPTPQDAGKKLMMTKPVKHFHQTIKKGVAPHDYYGEMRAVQSWVQNNVRYAFDPRDVEYFQTPRRTLKDLAGDCDDQAILTSSLLESIGYTTSVALCNPKGPGTPYSHAVSAVKFPKNQKVKLGDGKKVNFTTDKWYVIETIQKRPFGWAPKKADMWYYIKIK